MNYAEIAILTRDGICPTHVFTPVGHEERPAVIFYMDGLGIRPTLMRMAARLAEHGYIVLLPDLYYRLGAYSALDPIALFASGTIREATHHMMASTDNSRAADDSEALLDYIAKRKDIGHLRIGTTGYCMGGAISLTVAGRYPDQIAAAASFHGGYLATDSADSPHHLASKITGRLYIGCAEEDPSCPPEMVERLENALTAAQVDYLCEFYGQARHGWTMADFPVYDERAAELHWSALLDLFDRTLKEPS